MTTPRDPDRLIHAFLREGAEQLDDQVYDAVRAEIDQKRQRVVIGPWRVPTMSKLVPIGLGAAAVIAVLLLGSQFIGSPSSNVGGPASQPPASAAPSRRARRRAVAAPRRLPDARYARLRRELTAELHLTMHGFSLSVTPRDGPLKRRPSPRTGAGIARALPSDADVCTGDLPDHLVN